MAQRPPASPGLLSLENSLTSMVIKRLPETIPAGTKKFIGHYLVEQGLSSKPNSTAALADLDSDAFEQLILSIDWQSKDGAKLKDDFIRDAGSDAADIAAQFTMSFDTILSRIHASTYKTFTTSLKSIITPLLLAQAREPLLQQTCSCAWQGCWPALSGHGWPLCKACGRWRGPLAVTNGATGVERVSWIDFKGNVAIADGDHHEATVTVTGGATGPTGPQGPTGPGGTAGAAGATGPEGLGISYASGKSPSDGYYLQVSANGALIWVHQGGATGTVLATAP